MPQIIRSPDAADDVLAIASYIAQDNFEAALRWMALIDEKLRKLSEFPGIGAERDELEPGPYMNTSSGRFGRRRSMYLQESESRGRRAHCRIARRRVRDAVLNGGDAPRGG